MYDVQYILEIRKQDMEDEYNNDNDNDNEIFLFNIIISYTN